MNNHKILYNFIKNYTFLHHKDKILYFFIVLYTFVWFFIVIFSIISVLQTKTADYNVIEFSSLIIILIVRILPEALNNS